MSSRPAGDERSLHRGATKCKSLVAFHLLTKEQTNTGRLGWSCGHTVLAMPRISSIALLPFLSCPLPHASKQTGAWEQLTASDAKAPYAVNCNSLCSPALLKEKKEAVFLSSLVWGWGKEGERKPLSVLFILSWELSRGSQIWENVWIWDHGRLSLSIQYSSCRSAVRAVMPALNTEFTWFGKVGKTGRHRSPSALWCSFFPARGKAQWLGQPKKHTHGRGALKTSLPFSSPKCFLLLALFAYQWFLGKREKGRTTRGKYNLPFPEMTQHCCRDQQANVGPVLLHVGRSGTHKETITLRGEETSLTCTP